MPKIQIFATYNSDLYTTKIFCGFNIDINVINFYLINENTNEKKIINSQIYCQVFHLSGDTSNICTDPCYYNSSINENEKLLIEFIESPESLNGFFKQSSVSSLSRVLHDRFYTSPLARTIVSAAVVILF